ncbi:MAG TPA: GNAT family N-acetyltransferase [Thermomicrobiales bacterium]|nr:GNAT family N-acetyltransferase [Thermomicrobiales bacterium]
MLRVVEPGPERERYLPLLLLADASETQVRSYLQTGDLYVLADALGAPLGLVLVLSQAEGTAELKAVAVALDHQGQGVGQRLLGLVLAALQASGVRRVIVGTGNSSIGQIAFYQKAGFRLWRIERDVFTPERGYPPDLEEHGIRLRDLVWLDQALGDDRAERPM